MIRDLAGAGAVAADADVVVIGAGTVGLVIATLLARRGVRVVCLESGAAAQAGEVHELNDVVHRKAHYAGAAHGRYRCLGGTSTRWGGALIPFLAEDLVDAGWPLSLDALLAYLPAIESLFGLPSGSYELPGLLGAANRSHVARLAKWPSFKRRNVYQLLGAEVGAANGPVVWLNATAVEFGVSGGRLTHVAARAPDGSCLGVTAREFIVCAGAIESTRLLLEIDRQNAGCLRRHGDSLGRYFYDHLSVPVAVLEPIDRRALNRLLGFRFDRGGSMRNLRFEFAAHSPYRRRVRPSFAHVAFVAPPGSGFDSLREVFRCLLRRERPPLALIGRLLRASPWLARVAWWRFAERRQLYPDNAVIEVHMVIEQAPRAEHRIGLSPDRVDRYGMPLAEIDWTVTREDEETLVAAVDALQDTWAASPLAELARFVRLPAGAAEAQLAIGGGIYHPGGSTRLAADAATGVVDPQLVVYGLGNVRVAATSVLPTGGGANPTMMLLLLGLRCVDDVVARLAAASSGEAAGS